MTTTTETSSRHRTYGNWRKPQAPGIFNLGTVGSIVLILTPAFAVVGALFSLLSAITIVLIGLVVLALTSYKIANRPIGELMFVRVSFWRSVARRENRYHSGMLAEPYGAHHLPGILGRSELIGTTDGFGQGTGIVVLPQTGHYTAVLKLDPEGASLVDREQIDQWVAGYGHWLAQLAHEPGFVAATVTIETAPDPGTRLATSVASRRSLDAPPLAQNVLDTIVNTYPAGSAQVTAWATVTYRSTGTRNRRDREAVVNHVASRLPGLADTLRGTGAGAVRPMTAQEIAEQVKVAFDPEIATRLEQARAAGEPTGISWNDAGPRAHVEAWDSYRHDSGISRVWSMEEAPRGTVLARVLESLIAPHPLIPRKRVTLIYRPHTPGEAARIVDRDVRTANFVQNTRRGVAREQAAIRAAEQSATEEAEGAGVTRFSLLVAVTMNSAEDLDEADTIVDGLQGTARLQLRPVFAGQAAAFAATLPTGLILPEHATLPTSVREAL
uniref:SCO6880 family protein n=1 Tax=Amycolatopsis sp. CA-151526 TaxID=3239921 RepID=UPI003F492C80